MNADAFDVQMIKQLVMKDWQIYQKQLAAYVVGLLVGLTLVGVGKAWSFYIGALLLLVLLICAGGFAIQSSLLNERKEHTLPFVMSLPVTPMTFYWSKLLANVTIYLVPFTLVVGGAVFLILFTPLPDGLLVWSLLIFGFLAMIFFVSLCTALVVEAEGWNIFVQIGLSTTISPFIMGIGMIDAIGIHIKTNNIVWSLPAIGIFLAQFAVIALAIVFTRWVHRRKTSFL
jgi:ABC-2 type transport system permease protein